MSVEAITHQLVALTEQATKIRSELSPTPKQFKAISQSVHSLIIALRDADAQLWQQARVQQPELGEVERIIKHCPRTLSSLGALVPNYCQPHPAFPSLRVWKDTTSRDLEPGDIADLREDLAGTVSNINSWIDQLRDKTEKGPAQHADSESWKAIRMATEVFSLCPNRVWAIVRGQRDRATSLTKLIQPLRDNEHIVPHTGHDQCNYELCNHSRVDFTWVAQRHESTACKEHPCRPLRHRFPLEELDEASLSLRPTAWKLNGLSIIHPSQGYLAISHVWSDGTGTGAWLDREVNECLYSYFTEIARQFQCEGIWWDTICIPKDKTARSIAVNRMHLNYRDARVVFVHDCYLREWSWLDGESACIAIILSPWFSRGWTALELAFSHKVKIAFKNSVIKDLDEDILAKSETCTMRHQLASKLISNLRRGTVTTVDELLSILQGRNTSWPRDIAIIAGLLAGIEIKSGATQQSIYKDILRRMGKISAEHLFHNSPSMSDPAFGWCAANLLNMEIASAEHPQLSISLNGDVTGKWMVITDLWDIPLERYTWRGTHALLEMRLRWTLQQPDNYILLIEPQVTQQSSTHPTRAEAKIVSRALLVEPLKGTCLKHRVLGSVFFHPPLMDQEIKSMHGPLDVIIGDQVASRGGQLTSHTKHINRVPPDVQAQGDWTALHLATWRCDAPEVKKLLAKISPGVEDSSGRRPLHLASERGNKEIVSLLLDRKTDPAVQCAQGQTPIHRAGWGGSIAVVNQLLAAGADPDVSDSKGQTPLHLAAQNGHVEAASLLVKRGNRSIRMVQDSEGQTALHLAVLGGHDDTVKDLVRQGVDINTTNDQGWTPLHLAASAGNVALVEWLLDMGCSITAQSSDGLRPVDLAAKGGHDATMRRLLRISADASQNETSKLLCSAVEGGIAWVVSDILQNKRSLIETQNGQGRSLLHIAAAAGKTRMVDLLLVSGANFVDKGGETPLFYAARMGHASVAQQLLKKGADAKAVNKEGDTPIFCAVRNNHAVVTRLLLDHGAADGLDKPKKIGLLRIAVENGHEGILEVFLDPKVTGTTFHIPMSRVISLTYGIKAGIKETLLVHAGKLGQDSIAKLLLEQGADIENISGGFWRHEYYTSTALGEASLNGHVTTVKLLLGNGARTSPITSGPGIKCPVPLVSAAEHGHKEIVNLLLEAGADANAKCPDRSETALAVAALNGHFATVELLLNKGARIEPANPRLSFTAVPMVAAAKGGHEKIVKLLHQRGATINLGCVKHGDSALSAAASNGDLAMVEFLFANSACIQQTGSRALSYTSFPLRRAVEGGHEPVVKFLLQNGANCNFPDDTFGTPLQQAAKNGHLGIFQLLIQAGADVHYHHGPYGTAISVAATFGHEKIVKILIDEGADVNSGEPKSHTPLIRAAAHNHQAVVKLLIDHDANVNARGIYERTAFFEAARNGNPSIMKLLIDHGANIHWGSVGWESGTPISVAVESGNEEAVRLLLDLGADVNSRDRKGGTLLALAREKKYLAVEDLLLRYGADRRLA